MSRSGTVPSVAAMTDPTPQRPRPVDPRGDTRLAGLSWPAVISLGLLALARPLARITGADEVLGTPGGPLLLTLAVTAAWVLVVGLGRVPRPVLTLTLAGVTYALATLPLSAVLSTVIDGVPAGPLVNPVAIVPVLLLNAGWGALAGVLALGVQRLRGGHG